MHIHTSIMNLHKSMQIFKHTRILILQYHKQIQQKKVYGRKDSVQLNLFFLIFTNFDNLMARWLPVHLINAHIWVHLVWICFFISFSCNCIAYLQDSSISFPTKLIDFLINKVNINLLKLKVQAILKSKKVLL